jgi:uncharacterized protein YndB with AHSA1/START domain
VEILRKLRRAVTLLFAAVGALLVLATLVGFALPRAHRLTRSAVYPQPPPAVWAAVADLPAYPAWVPRVERMEQRAGSGGRVLWDETNVYGQVTYEEVERLPGRRLVLRMADEGVPYGGTWTYELARARGGGTRVSITEDAWVSNPFFRFLARVVIGLDEEEDLFLEALGDRLADGPTPRAASRRASGAG